MDDVDIARIAIAIAKCGYLRAGMFRVRDCEATRQLMLAILAAEDAAGTPDPDGDRWLYGSFIEMMECRELKKLWAFLINIPALHPRRG